MEQGIVLSTDTRFKIINYEKIIQPGTGRTSYVEIGDTVLIGHNINQIKNEVYHNLLSFPAMKRQFGFDFAYTDVTYEKNRTTNNETFLSRRS